MAGPAARSRLSLAPAATALREVQQDPAWARRLLIAIALLSLGLWLVLPMATVLVQALSQGWPAYWAAVSEPDAVAAVRLTLLTALICVPLNLCFGVTAAWLLTRYRFWGRDLLLTLVDLPFSVSPVVSGLVYVLVFGLQGWWGRYLDSHGIRIIFAVPGIVLVTLFVTAPFVARELIPVLESTGLDEEEAARVLGASPLKSFFAVTLPNIKWGLLYGVLLCNARAMGEFGAVSVVSGHIRGVTDTLPLHVEVLYNGYQFAAAFAAASLLALLALVTLAAKTAVEWRAARERESA